MSKIILIIVAIAIISAGFMFLGRGDNQENLAQTKTVKSPINNTETEVLESNLNFAPNFMLETLDGTDIILADYRGEKAVILDFFATWCPNCKRNIPNEVKLYEKYGKDVEVIAINLQESPSKVRDFANEYNIPFPVALDPKGEVSKNFGANYTNFHVLINKEGEIVRKIPGDIKESNFTELIGV
jgi:peroxiredoxin